MAPVWRARVDTLGRGESLVAVLERAGMHRVEATRALRELGDIGPRAVRPGLTVTSRALGGDSVPAEISFQPTVDRVVRLRYLAGAWKVAEERLALAHRHGRGDGGRHGLAAWGHPYRARRAAADARALGARVEARGDLRVSRRHEPRPAAGRLGAAARRTAHRARRRAARRHDPRCLAAGRGTALRGRPLRSRRAGGEYFDHAGKSLRAAFLRAPLEFRRVSSVFGMRRHPILGIWKAHRGTDYAARAGTPVRAIGDGVVVRAGRYRGYGNTVEIRHRNGYVTRYGHLRGFARGVRVGRTVSIGQTVAFVGSTGLSTAPHLHFEVLVDGVQRDPRAALRDKSGEPLPTRERRAFAALRGELLARLDARPTGDARLALAE
jgi:murein DD-endopeptidase MepM/ murein hydrolase activator NlpD